MRSSHSTQMTSPRSSASRRAGVAQSDPLYAILWTGASSPTASKSEATARLIPGPDSRSGAGRRTGGPEHGIPSHRERGRPGHWVPSRRVCHGACQGDRASSHPGRPPSTPVPSGAGCSPSPGAPAGGRQESRSAVSSCVSGASRAAQLWVAIRSSTMRQRRRSDLAVRGPPGPDQAFSATACHMAVGG